MAVVQQVQQSLCQSDVGTQLNEVESGQETRAVGVVHIIANCLQFIDQAELQPNVSTSDPLTRFALAVGNNFACDKIANTVLALTSESDTFCNAILQD
jgi:hypothetical protein